MSAIYTSEAGEREILGRYTRALDAWPVPAERMRVPTREGETFVLVCGPANAPPLVLLHGSGANATTWWGDVPTWARHFRVYAVDLVGEPGLSARSRPSLDSGAFAQWLDDVLDGLGLTGTSLLGMSLGGWLAVDYTTRHPERITRLALLCPGGLGRQKVGWLVKAVLLRPFGRWGSRRSARNLTGLDTREDSDALDAVLATFAHFRPRREPLPRFDDAALRRLTMPVLVIAGARDAMFDARGTVRRVRASVPHAAVTLLPDTGHAITGQSGPVLEFLRGHDGD